MKEINGINGIINNIKFDNNGLVPAIAQDYKAGSVLMMAYMNREAVEATVKTGEAHYWSRSRQKLWKKGETSGHCQLVKSLYIDCDNDTLLLKVEQKGAACHTGHYSCFYRKLEAEGAGEAPGKASGKNEAPCQVSDENEADILKQLYETIIGRKNTPKEGSYTNYLFTEGIDKILKKVGEEAAEVIIASKNTGSYELIYEISDLVYHLFVLMAEKGVRPGDIYRELRKRYRPE